MQNNELLNSEGFQTLFKSLIKEAVIEYLKENDKQLSSDYLTRQQAAKMLGVSLPTINNWVDRQILNPRYLGDKRYFSHAEIINTLEANRKYKQILAHKQ